MILMHCVTQSSIFLIPLFVFVSCTWTVGDARTVSPVHRLCVTAAAAHLQPRVRVHLVSCVSTCDVWFIVHSLFCVAYGVSLRGVQPSLMKTDERELEPLPVSTAMHTCTCLYAAQCTLSIQTRTPPLPKKKTPSYHFFGFYNHLLDLSVTVLVSQGHETASHWTKTFSQNFIPHVSHRSPECIHPKVSV